MTVHTGAVHTAALFCTAVNSINVTVQQN